MSGGCPDSPWQMLSERIPVQSTRQIRFNEDLNRARSNVLPKQERLVILGRLEAVGCNQQRVE